MTGVVIGIDVQAARDCPFAVLDTRTSIVRETGWIAAYELVEKVQQLASRHGDAVFAIDAPRMPLPAPRAWYWRNNRGWHRGAGNEKGKGRHCEVVIKASNLANPQWTPLAEDAPEWMQHGFKIFESLQGRARALEVFPSASYRMLNEGGDVQIAMPLKGFLPGPKDMLDAVVAAVTGMEFLAGRGQEVGGGDGLGTIVLPRRISSDITEVLHWPSSLPKH